MKKLFGFLFLFLLSSSVLVSCQYIESQHNHKYSKIWTTTETEHWRHASCEHTDLIVNKGTHTFDEGIVTKSPTEEAAGIKTYTCTVCKHTRTEPVSQLEHTHKFDTEEWVFNDSYHWKNATCEHTTETSQSGTHEMSKNVCSTCGYMAESQGLAFALLSNGTYEVIGHGSNTDSAVVIPATYEGKPVTSIGAEAFFQYGIITSLTVPSSIKTIKADAFNGCRNLKEVTFKENSSLEGIYDYAFANCDLVLSRFVVPKSVTHIGEAVLQNCVMLEEITVEDGNTAYKSVDGNLFTADGTKLLQYAPRKQGTEFTVPDEVTSIGIGAFAFCSYLQKISFNLNCPMTTLPKDAFYYSGELLKIELPEGITVIESGAFAFCQKLIEINVPENLVDIKSSAFEYCSELAEFDLPASLKRIGAKAFAQCKKFTKMIIPDGVTSVGDKAMAGCTGIVSVSIPATVKAFGEKMFEGSNSLQTVTVDSENTTLKSIDGHLYNKAGTTIIYYSVANPATTFTLPEGVTTINVSAFYACKNLENVILPSTLKKIEADAFLQCVNLKTINLPEGLTDIETATFNGCSSLQEITFPTTMTKLSKDLLLGCDSLSSLIIPKNITVIEYDALAYLNLDSIEFENTSGWMLYHKGNLSEPIDPKDLYIVLKALDDSYIPDGSEGSYVPDGSEVIPTPAELVTSEYQGYTWIWTQPTEQDSESLN